MILACASLDTSRVCRSWHAMRASRADSRLLSAMSAARHVRPVLALLGRRALRSACATLAPQDRELLFAEFLCNSVPATTVMVAPAPTAQKARTKTRQAARRALIVQSELT